MSVPVAMNLFHEAQVMLEELAKKKKNKSPRIFMELKSLWTLNKDRPTWCHKISLVQWLITNLNVILYLSTCHTVYISVLILFMIMPQLIINTYVTFGARGEYSG